FPSSSEKAITLVAPASCDWKRRPGWLPPKWSQWPMGSSEVTVSTGLDTSFQVAAAGEEQSSKLRRNSCRLEVKNATPPWLTVPYLREATLGFQSMPMEGSPEDSAPPAVGGAG